MHRTILLAAAVLGLAACQSNPATGRRQLLLLSERQTISLGDEAKPALITEYGGEVASAGVRAYVSKVGARIARRTEGDNPALPWDFTVLDSDVINAFALPGGNVFVSRGLLVRLESEAELAGVLGHEIGHVTARHVNERISRQMVVQGIAAGASAAAGGSESQWAAVIPLVVGVGGQGYLLSFNREQENEADALGVRYMTMARYNPQGMVDVLKVLDAASTGPRPPQILSTHPDPAARIETVSALVRGPFKYTQRDERWKTKAREYEQGILEQLPPATAVLEGAAWCGICRAETRTSPDHGLWPGPWPLAE